MLTKEQQFIQRVLGKYGLKYEDSSREAEVLAEQAAKLQLLVSAGCRAYELVEYPRVVLLDEQEIIQRIGRVREIRGAEGRISVAMLRYAESHKSDAVVWKQIRNYLGGLKEGHVNRMDEVAETLRCSDEEMMDVLIHCPRSVGVKHKLDLVRKIKTVLRYGARLDDIKANMHVLANNSIDLIEERARRLSEMGFDKPLNVGLVGRDEKRFLAIVEQMRSEPRAPHAEDSEQVIAMLTQFTNKRIHSLKPKVDLLLSAGYNGADIAANAVILVHGLERISRAVAYLREHNLDLPSLAICHQYARSSQISGFSRRRPIVRKQFAHVLGCSHKDIAWGAVQKDNVGANRESVMAENLAFLREKGVSIAVMRRMPVVLAHDVHIVRAHWERLETSADELGACFLRWKNDDAKRLNLLQYSVERTTNFATMTAVASAVDEDDARGGGLFEDYAEQKDGGCKDGYGTRGESSDSSDSESDGVNYSRGVLSDGYEAEKGVQRHMLDANFSATPGRLRKADVL